MMNVVDASCSSNVACGYRVSVTKVSNTLLCDLFLFINMEPGGNNNKE